MRASVVIAAYNEGDALGKTVRSVVESCAGLDHEIVIADDASWDGSVEELTRRFPHVRVVRHEERRGTSPTKDLGARNARGEVLVFLDGHCKPELGSIARLVEDVEALRGEAIVTPTIPALDVERWKNQPSQVGHGYFLDLEKFGCGWLPLSELRPAREGRLRLYESPALIGCVLAVSRELYDALWGFDPHMRLWGVEDLDLGLRCWLMGHRILHDPEAVVGHRFREAFDYAAPLEQVLANQLRMARKNFTDRVWRDWVDRCRLRHPGRLADHPEGLWTRAWGLFEADGASVEAERSYLLARRVRDEFGYAERFGLTWPRLHSAPAGVATAQGKAATETAAIALQASPSPPPCTESTIGNWYNGYWKQINNLVGADAEIETTSPKLDCEPTGTFWDGVDVWVGVTLRSATSVVAWAQVGYRVDRPNGTTTKRSRIYGECQVGSVYHRTFGKAPGSGINRYTCNMIDPSNGTWYFYYNGVSFDMFQHPDWVNKTLNWLDMTSETHHQKTRCPGTPKSPCRYNDCRYRPNAAVFTSVNLVAGDSHVTQPQTGAFGQKLGSGSPLDNFEIWDTRS